MTRKKDKPIKNVKHTVKIENTKMPPIVDVRAFVRTCLKPNCWNEDVKSHVDFAYNYIAERLEMEDT